MKIIGLEYLYYVHKLSILYPLFTLYIMKLFGTEYLVISLLWNDNNGVLVNIHNFTIQIT